MNFTIYLADRYHASIRQSGGEDVAFWPEMEFVQWYLIRVLSEFYESPALLPDTLAAVYLDRDYLLRFLPGEDPEIGDLRERLAEFRGLQRERRIAPYARMTDAEMELELQKEQRATRILAGEIEAGILRRPVAWDPERKNESPKYIRAAFPECRVEFRGFGRFLGYSDLNQILFWSPLLVLRFFHRKYIPKGDEILAILISIASHAGLLHAGRLIAGDNHRALASEGIDALRKKYISN
ncbi:MAG: hypothetical protein JW748_08335 [Anaerolineales bacterium]|nr:hypothetical protein [Anaerolineales bacterium]